MTMPIGVEPLVVVVVVAAVVLLQTMACNMPFEYPPPPLGSIS